VADLHLLIEHSAERNLPVASGCSSVPQEQEASPANHCFIVLSIFLFSIP
jgi:hypothetical protein